jgi:uncharacterized protein (DUF433 family)
MTVLQEAERLLTTMSPGQKAQMLQWILKDLGDAFPGIASHPEVCGGVACIVRTRIPVWALVHARLLGTTDADLLRCYPSLRAEDLTDAWAYYRAHRDEITHQIAENEEA